MRQDSEKPDDDRRDGRHYPLIVFLIALLVRLIYLVSSSGNPAFFDPVVDSNTYLDLARKVASGNAAGTSLFWQPVFYPVFLAAVFRFFGESIWLIKIMQAVIGACSCLLIFQAARRVFSARTALASGLMMALYGPLIFYESELLGEGWAVFWSACMIYLFARAQEEDHPLYFMALGFCGGLGTLTRPPLLIVFVFGCAGFAWALSRRMEFRQALIRLGLALICFAIVLHQPARICREQTGRYLLLPSSSGINLYIGNNKDWQRTVAARPGYEWRRIYMMPRSAGVTNAWEESSYYQKLVHDYVKAEPGLFLKGLAAKTVRFFNSRELPRNIDIYLFRKWSPVLSVLVWKAGPFGFPFGLLLPLTVLGLVLHWRRIPPAVWAFVLLYPAVIILYFVSGRYRILLIPALMIPAGSGLVHWVNLIAAGNRRRTAGLAAGFAVLMLLTSLPARFPEEQVNFEAELYRSLGFQLHERQASAEAIPFYEKSLELEPDLVTALNDMSNALTALGRPREALAFQQKAVAVNPLEAGLHHNLGLLYLDEGRYPEAEAAFREALALETGIPNRNFYLALSLMGRQRWEEASEFCAKELEINPEHKLARELYEEITKSVASGDLPTGMRLNIRGLGTLKPQDVHP